MQAPAQPRLVARPTLAARLELFLELTHLHRKEVLFDRLHRRCLEDAYDSEDSDDAAASPPVDAAAAAPTDLKRKRAKGAKVRIKKTLGEAVIAPLVSQLKHKRRLSLECVRSITLADGTKASLEAQAGNYASTDGTPAKLVVVFGRGPTVERLY